VVQAGGRSYRAGLVIKTAVDIDNLCTCRDSREWGTICAHSVAVGLHHLQRLNLLSSPAENPASNAAHANRLNAGLATKPPVRTEPVRRLQIAAPGSPGEKLELSFILPPNLLQALERGKIMLCIEGVWRQGRTMLNALPLTTLFALSDGDRGALDFLMGICGSDIPGMIQIGTDQLAGLLGTLVEHPRITAGKTSRLEVSNKPWKLPLHAHLEVSGEIGVKISGAMPPCIIGAQAWCFSNNTFRPIQLPKSFIGLMRGPVQIARPGVPQFLCQDWPLLSASSDIQANFKLEDFSLAPQPPRFMLNLAGGLAQLQAQLQCAYGARIMTAGVTNASEGLWLPDPACPTRYSTRDIQAEQAAMALLLRCGFSSPDVQGRMQLQGQNAVLNFFAGVYPKLQKKWTVTLEERLEKSTNASFDRVEPEFRVTASGEQWFDLSVSFKSSSGQQLSAADIQQLLLSGQNHKRLSNGRIAIMDGEAIQEFNEVLRDCSPEQRNNEYRLNQVQAGFLDAALKTNPDWKLQAPDSWLKRTAVQRGDLTLTPPPLGDLEAVLRPYQKTGVAWLHFLRQNGFGGILADEMGLGKTVQTLAFLRSIADRNADSPSLIVCPTSLVYNWIAESLKFTPELKVLDLTGANRHDRFSRIRENDLVITSYGLLRRDADQYRAIEFDTVILDEAQHIKNRQTQNSQAVKSIRARRRFVLTGTPMENSVLDLWSIFDFLMPGYLGNAKDFRERYELPIVRDKDVQAQARLSKRLRPFLLRRLKKDVAPELPEKIEQVAYCDLTQDQAAVYEQIMEASRSEIYSSVESQGVNKSRMLIFTALLRLRQACCDLRLLPLAQVKPETASGKMDIFEELMEEILDGGHRVLVFSQFVTMLALLKEKLDKEGIAYAYLDGASTNRGAIVDSFQRGNEIPVFLISLKAGGAGLNLTGADTVIHFDPWWNPAVEDQATGRAHRIGQTRIVTSYKLIARGTIEEKMLHLQERKREWIQGTLGDANDFLNTLSWDDIQELLR
jgi:superfamily II DNA or RNA helicase